MKLFHNLSTDLAEEVLKSLFLFLALGAIFFNGAGRLSNFGRQPPTEHSCIIISKSMYWLRRRSRFKVFLFLALAPSCSTERNGLSNFGRQSPKKHSCEIISKSVHRFSRRSCYKLISIFSSGGHLVQRSGTV